MNPWEAITIVEQMKQVKAELGAAERTSAYSREIGAKHREEVEALELVLEAARKALRAGML